MTSPIDELVAVLVVEREEYARLIPLLAEEERVLVNAEAATLTEITSRREALVVRLARLERDRRTALGRVAAALGVDPRELSLSRLLEVYPAHAPVLRSVADDLRAVLGPLLERHRRNRFLAERTLTWLRGLFAGLAAALVPKSTYTRSGQSDRPVEGLQLLDRRA